MEDQTPIEMKTAVRLMTRYNLWANRKICAYLAKAPNELLDQHIESSFPSIRLTLLHIWDAEHVWLKRLHGFTPTQFPSQSFTGSTHAAIEGLLALSEEFDVYVQSLKASDVETVVTYTMLAGTPHSNSRAEMIQHCMNHSTYHRGQLIMMARQLGMTSPVSTDLIYYLRENPVKS